MKELSQQELIELFGGWMEPSPFFERPRYDPFEGFKIVVFI
jgi:hypothetical protein